LSPTSKCSANKLKYFLFCIACRLVKEVWVNDRRYIICLNEEERRKDAHDREAILAHLQDQLRCGDKSLVGNKGYRRYLKLEGSGHFAIDKKQIEIEQRYDAFWVLRTSTDYSAETVAVFQNSRLVQLFLVPQFQGLTICTRYCRK
jgi:hypothetical protein